VSDLRERFGPSWFSGCCFAVLFASLLDGLALDLFPPVENGFSSSEVDVGRGEIVECLVVAPVIVVVDEAFDGKRKVAGQIVVLEDKVPHHL
jgi:hypothetical protein